MTRNETTTGNINHFGRATAPTASSRNPGYSPRYYQGTQSLVRNPQYQRPATTVAQNNATQSRSFAGANSGSDRSRPRLNQQVVQQVSSTAKSNLQPSTRTVARPASLSSLTVAARPRQDCVCVPTQAAANAGLFRQSNIAANQAPSLASSGVGTGYQYQPYQFQPGLGVPQIGRRENVLTPFFRGSGMYTPLIPLIQTQQGTYLGQGIIGQPTAYVNGQPLRNLLRYIFP